MRFVLVRVNGGSVNAVQRKRKLTFVVVIYSFKLNRYTPCPEKMPLYFYSGTFFPDTAYMST